MSQDIKINLVQQYDERYQLYQNFRKEIEHQIKRILQAEGIECNAIVSRLKSKESFIEKIERKQKKYISIEDITDVVGVRIITYYSEDVDKIVQIIETEFDVDRDNSIDKREAMEPDKFGYCSVHYIVKMNTTRLNLRENHSFEGLKCEIQIRSILQHAWAEIEHDIGYKSEIAIPKELRRSFSRIAGLLEIADKEFDEIRTKLVEYKKNAEVKIEDSDFEEYELNTIILEILIEKDENIQRINKHIGKVTGESSLKKSDNLSFERSLQQLAWLGIRTVRQFVDILPKYTEIAMKIATVKLGQYKNSSNKGMIKETIAYFYICYAILLTENTTEERIERYIVENKIGSLAFKDEAVKELYAIAQMLREE